jgi:hypothetical protein
MRKIVVLSIFGILSISFITSCQSSNKLSPQNCQKNMYCYKNINFGITRGASYEKGIRDGCRTGEGTFTKDYYASSTNKDYYDGWILGRSRCKQILPNEGTLLAEEKSRQRAEYQIRKLKMEQEQQPEVEGIVDSLLEEDNIQTAQEEEY